MRKIWKSGIKNHFLYEAKNIILYNSGKPVLLNKVVLMFSDNSRNYLKI